MALKWISSRRLTVYLMPYYATLQRLLGRGGQLLIATGVALLLATGGQAQVEAESVKNVDSRRDSHDFSPLFAGSLTVWFAGEPDSSHLRKSLLDSFHQDFPSFQVDDRIIAPSALAAAWTADSDTAKPDVAFIDNLQESKVRFVCADMPEANETMISFMAVMAKHERQAVSDRTKRALQAIKALEADPAKAKARRKAGKRALGNPNGARALRRAGKGNVDAVAEIKAKADRHAQDVLPVVDDIRAAGISTLLGIAAELNDRGILTARKGQWYPTTVRNLLARSGRLL